MKKNHFLKHLSCRLALILGLIALNCKETLPPEVGVIKEITADKKGSLPKFYIKPGTNITLPNNYTPETEKFRLVWHQNVTSEATLAWVQESGENIKVHYGVSDFGTDFQKYKQYQKPARELSYKGMTHYFANLTGLQADTAYYLVIAHSKGNSPRLWFRTAPLNRDFTFIAGGDSRSNRYVRRKANKMVARLRPLFVAFGGDYTIFGLAYQWQQWLDDWQLTIGRDGLLVPIVPARGNHERTGAVHKIFGIAPREYHQIRVGSFFSLYTLNSEVAITGEQKRWLAATSANDTTTFKAAQYHRPVRPHVRGKSNAELIYEHWVPIFEQNKFKLIFESDAHTVKATWPILQAKIKGSHQGFIRNDALGIVYLGEGTWGAPLRPANLAKPWTRDSGSFNQIKWLKVTSKQIQVRTVNYENVDEVGFVSDETKYSAPENLKLFFGKNSRNLFIGQANHIELDFKFPSEGALVSLNQKLNIEIETKGAASLISYIDIFANGRKIIQLKKSPYQTYGKISLGGHVSLTAQARSKNGLLLAESFRQIQVGAAKQTYHIISASDDAEERYNGEMRLFSSDLEMVEDVGIFSTRKQIIGLRFRGIRLPKAATIKRAYIQFTAQDIDDEVTQLNIYAEGKGRPAPIQATSYNLSSRTLTKASTKWNVPPWHYIEDSSQKQRSPNLKKVIEEVISHNDWQEGGDLVFIIKGEGEREAFTFDQERSQAAKLIIFP